MNLFTFARSRSYRNFMSKLYGWGASLVILGALFKINHYYGANTMLIIGMGTEAIIFFFSAFEPPHVEPDWSLVHPEFSYLYHGGEAPETPVNTRSSRTTGKSTTQELDDMLSKAKIGPELIESLGQGLKNLSESATKLANVGNATMATDDYVKNLNNASNSVGKLSETYQKASQKMDAELTETANYHSSIKNAAQSANQLAQAYAQTSEALKTDLSSAKDLTGSIKAATDSVNGFAQKYVQTSEMLIKSAQSLDFSKVETSQFNQQIKKISDNLAALNTVYELQLKGSNQYVDNTAKLQSSLTEFMNNLNASNEKTANYKTEVETLTKRVAALNSVYGNMLAAMNVNTK